MACDFRRGKDGVDAIYHGSGNLLEVVCIAAVCARNKIINEDFEEGDGVWVVRDVVVCTVLEHGVFKAMNWEVWFH